MFETEDDGRAFMDSWFEEPGIDVSRTCYHGKASFIGNEARKLLRKADRLEERLYQALAGTDKIPLAQLYMKALKEFDRVTHSCFGQKLDLNYATYIQEFMSTYRSLGISVTLKVHILESHTREFLMDVGAEETGLGLGYFSEQVCMCIICQPFCERDILGGFND